MSQAWCGAGDPAPGHDPRNPLSWLELDETELAEAIAAEEPIVREWRRDSRQVAGPDINDLLATAAAPAAAP